MVLLLLQQLSFAADSLQERVSSALAEAIYDRIIEQFPDSDAQIRIANLGLKVQTHCVGDFETRVLFSKHENFQGPLNVRINAFDDSGKCGHWRFYPKVEILMKMPVAANTTAAGSKLKIIMKKGRYDLVHGTLLEPNDHAWLSRKMLKNGQPITVDLAYKMPLNFNGDMVQLLVTNQSVTISASGKLLSDAHLGQKVNVLSYATSSVVQGTLTDHGKVEIGVSK